MFKYVFLKFHLLCYPFFRHTYASILLAQGIDPVNIAKRLGHKNTIVTHRTYEHMFEEIEAREADKHVEIINAIEHI